MEQIVSIATVTFLLGLIIGHWLSLGRDKRKEFNELSEPIRKWILDEIDQPSPHGGYPSRIKMDIFESYLGPLSRRRFRRACDRMRAARKAAIRQDPSTGDISFNRDSTISNAFRDMLPFTKRR